MRNATAANESELVSFFKMNAIFCFSFKAFEELERALGVAQKAEEARKQLQVQLEEQVREVERTSEEERKSLQQELTRVKQEVVSIMKVRKGRALDVVLFRLQECVGNVLQKE